MEKQIIPADSVLPNKLLLIPLLGKPIFPGIFTPLMISSKEDVAVIDQAMEGDKVIGLVLLKNEEEDDIPNNLYQIGTVAKIVKRINLPDGGLNVFISTLKRFKIKKNLTQESPLIAAVDYLDDENNADEVELKALTRSLISEMKQISEGNPLFSEEMRLNMVNIDQPGKIADFIASILNIGRQDQQTILETLEIKARMEMVLVHIKKEQELIRIQKKISKQINEKIEKSQREYFLREELKAIKQELGIATDAKTSEYQKFKEAIDKLPLEGEVLKQVTSELDKFSLMEPSSSEYIVTRNYIETIANLPWGEPELKDIDLSEGQKILDRDHYGLEDVKERILEFLAVKQLKKDSKGSILCLVGPPGVGKTSIGKSVATALGRPFFRFSVGGMRDEAEIKGHRRTYVGAMPGKIIQGMKIVGDKAPVFMIDEIDKLGQSYQGDPSSALLEVLDPEQNINFRDHYLDLPFDISHVMFVATANTLDTIPRPLLDRMEIIRLSGYIAEEKIAIAKKYIIPKSLEKNGLKKKDVKYLKSGLDGIATNYAREAGMRNFEKMIEKVHRKIAKKIVLKEEEGPFSIGEDNLKDFLGQPIFREDEIKAVTAPGMTIGLAWTNFGGDTLIIEALATKGKGGLKLTGQMGEVMQESASIAYTYVKSIAEKWGVEPKWFDEHAIHLHIPEGATPKDGPSAGITMASALLSLVTGKVIKKHLGMTGELSLAGKVMPIGGLKEKTIAARRNKLKHIIIPYHNSRDLEEIPEHVKKGIKFYPVEHINEVFDIIF
ncbi:endopeptidase La [Spirochaeta cellobiosiphila]|uniref:endopeptidase La n=1 Tax=Spirochaeta cellobiosiphila TaxID=504483 RepID=UPI0003FDBD8A